MDPITKRKLAEFICGDDKSKHPVYRSSYYMTKFFQDIGINVSHDGTSRNPWTVNVVNNLNGTDLQKVILRLGSPRLYGGDWNNNLNSINGGCVHWFYLDAFLLRLGTGDILTIAHQCDDRLGNIHCKAGGILDVNFGSQNDPAYINFMNSWFDKVRNDIFGNLFHSEKLVNPKGKGSRYSDAEEFIHGSDDFLYTV